MSSAGYPEDIRQEQIREARRTLSLPPGTPRPVGRSSDERRSRPDKPANKSGAKGHEAFLKALVMSHATVVLNLNTGAEVRGTIKHTDKYTLTVHHNHSEDGPIDEVFYKHALESFYSLTPKAPEQTEPVAND